VGTTVEVALHVDVDRRLSVEEAHDIGEHVQREVEEVEDISRAFIHIDPLEIFTPSRTPRAGRS